MSRTFRTLFSGGELFGCGAMAAGWRHVDGFEIDSAITNVARLNGFTVHAADVRTVDWAALPPVDHLHASPSCKSASTANDNAGETIEDIECAEATARAIAVHRGRTFSLENVWAYRNFESFLIILLALRRAGFSYDYEHVNSADYGVPQTRKRLILRAVRGADVPPLNATHRRGGDLYHAPWGGWYGVIEDLLPMLPETKPAPWQEARLPQHLHTALFHSGISRDHHGNEYTQQSRPPDEPAYTVSTMPAGWYKAFLLASNCDGELAWPRGESEPAHTVTTAAAGRVRAWLVGDQSRSGGEGVQLRSADAPAFTVRAGHEGRGGQPRGPIAGRWVRMTIAALGRFQTVPPWYRGLTSEINGNGVPCELARAIMESFTL